MSARTRSPREGSKRGALGLAAGLCLGTLLVGCGAGPRFQDRAVVWQVDDARPIPEPEENEYLKFSYFGDLFFFRRSERLFEIRDLEPAHNTNALDEVPNSTWFTNRIGLFDLTPEEVVKGPVVSGPPQLPLVVSSGKGGGGNPGFIAEDATGRKFLVKFDTRENPELQTAANLIVNRFFWAAGYNVPEDFVFYFHRQDLSLEEGATMENALGDDVPFDPQTLEQLLSHSPLTQDGAYRATASLFLDGVPKGGFTPSGTRDDDPNDVIPHEHRRELRGLRVLSAWLNHTDMKEDNTLDMYVDGHLVHYFIDFGEALGGHPAEKGRLEDGWEHYWDWERQAKATVTFGLIKRPWEDIVPPPYESIGPFVAEPFDPLLWREAYPYWPFFELTEADAFWGAKIVMRFTDEHIRAVVEAADYSNPDAERYMADTLIARRDAVGRTFLELLSPLDRFRVERDRVCGVDLGVVHGIASKGEVEVLRDGDLIARAAVGTDGRFCVRFPLPDGYQVVSMQVRRGDVVRPPLALHIRGGETPELLGLVRDP